MEAVPGQASRGALGILLSGGCDGLGRLPWEEFLPVIARVREELDLHVSVHSGLITREIARGLACAGVEQVLLDVIGSPATYREVYGLENGPMALYESLEVIIQAGLSLVPHIVAGLHFGCLVGEYEALRIVKGFMPEVLVVVVLMNLKGTRMAHVTPPGAEDLKDFFCKGAGRAARHNIKPWLREIQARFDLPGAACSFGRLQSHGPSFGRDSGTCAGNGRALFLSGNMLFCCAYLAWGLAARALFAI